MFLAFNASEYEQKLLTPGEYEVEIRSAEYKVGKTDPDRSMIGVQYLVIGQADAPIIFDYILLPKKGEEHENLFGLKLRAFCECFDVSLTGFDPIELVGKVGFIKVIIQAASEDYAESNKASAYIKRK
jgi:hypothetical protein